MPCLPTRRAGGQAAAEQRLTCCGILRSRRERRAGRRPPTGIRGMTGIRGPTGIVQGIRLRESAFLSFIPAATASVSLSIRRWESFFRLFPGSCRTAGAPLSLMNLSSACQAFPPESRVCLCCQAMCSYCLTRCRSMRYPRGPRLFPLRRGWRWERITASI